MDIIGDLRIYIEETGENILVREEVNRWQVSFIQTTLRSPPNATSEIKERHIYILTDSIEKLHPFLFARLLIHEVVETRLRRILSHYRAHIFAKSYDRSLGVVAFWIIVANILGKKFNFLQKENIIVE